MRYSCWKKQYYSNCLPHLLWLPAAVSWGSLLAGARVEFPVQIPRGALSCPSWLLAPVLGLRECFFGVIHHGPLFSISSFPRWLLTVYYQGNLGARLLKQIRAGQGMQEEEIRAGPPGWLGVEKGGVVVLSGYCCRGKSTQGWEKCQAWPRTKHLCPGQGGTQNLCKPAAEATKGKSLKERKDNQLLFIWAASLQLRAKMLPTK